ncbi:MAG: KamA family radical SAM protein [Desulfobacterales bacterium]
MNSNQIQRKLDDIFTMAPSLKEIILSDDSLNVKRRKFRSVLSNQLLATFDDDPSIPPLEWVLTRDAIRVFRMVLSSRSEKLAGYSFLKYINDLLHHPDLAGLPAPSTGFFRELEHLLRGIMGKTGVYSDKIPTFIKYEGKKAARLRSADLSRMARTVDRFVDRYPCGLDEAVIGQRRLNTHRILKHFKATDGQWDDWKWQLAHTIGDADLLASLVKITDEEHGAVASANAHNLPFGITPYYLSLMDNETSRNRDYAIRAQVIPSLYNVSKTVELRKDETFSQDFMLERNTSPIDGITRRYPKIVILKPFLTCPQICVYCQRNWEVEGIHSSQAALSEEKLERAVQWIADVPEISEVLITGGDPLMLSDATIRKLLLRLSKIQHVERIRIGTRSLVTLPQRITDTLVRDISRFHVPGKREILIITHFEHPYEVTPQAMEATQKFRRAGISVYNQLVYTFYNSRKFEAVALRKKLRSIGVSPYYTFSTKGKEETDDFRVPIARLLQEQKEDARLVPGSVRTDETVFNVPGLGKNYLRADQHHDVISILPDGRRVLEFHPWEKKLSLVDTYIYTDVSIHDYLKRLRAGGENLSHYKTIWYYY